jgi:uncharacterized membrane protein
MPDVQRLALLAHLLAAFAFAAGYVGTNMLTEMARRARDLEERSWAITLSGRFDRLLTQRGGTALIVTGPIVLWTYGYSITTPWIVGSTALFLLVPVIGATYWAGAARRVEAAIAEGDDAAAASILNEPRSVLISRLENAAVLIVVVLMVTRPG